VIFLAVETDQFVLVFLVFSGTLWIFSGILWILLVFFNFWPIRTDAGTFFTDFFYSLTDKNRF
jgi:hypothetical protein